MSLFLFVCLSVCLFVYISVCLHFCLSVCLSSNSSSWVCVSICTSINSAPITLLFYLSICQLQGRCFTLLYAPSTNFFFFRFVPREKMSQRCEPTIRENCTMIMKTECNEVKRMDRFNKKTIIFHGT